MRVWAVRIRYLESPYTGDGKWHQYTTKWYLNSSCAWADANMFENKHTSNWDESVSSLMHKER